MIVEKAISAPSFCLIEKLIKDAGPNYILLVDFLTKQWVIIVERRDKSNNRRTKIDSVTAASAAAR